MMESCFVRENGEGHLFFFFPQSIYFPEKIFAFEYDQQRKIIYSSLSLHTSHTSLFSSSQFYSVLKKSSNFLIGRNNDLVVSNYLQNLH